MDRSIRHLHGYKEDMRVDLGWEWKGRTRGDAAMPGCRGMQKHPRTEASLAHRCAYLGLPHRYYKNVNVDHA